MPGLKDDPNKFRGEISHSSSGVRSQTSVTMSCLGGEWVPCWELLSQITTSEPSFPQGAEDPAVILVPGPMESLCTKCNQKFATKEFYQFWPCFQPHPFSPRQCHFHQLRHGHVGICGTCKWQERWQAVARKADLKSMWVRPTYARLPKA